ncbi:MAG TPA: hypothetical protein DEQ61_11370 [Streptomyces sp.]|nr:hypothetical protein [Streptomyces sp.]
MTVAAVLAGLSGCAGDASGEAAKSTSGARPTPSPGPRWDTRPDSLAAVGDSITRGFDACGVLADCPEVSWVTGTDPEVESLAMRLLEDPAGSSWNLARSSSTMAELPAQMAEAVRHEPELVTVMTGANDACRDSVGLMTPVADFRADFSTALKRLRTALPDTQVYVASVPDLHRLWSEGRKNPLGKEIWKLGICQSMLSAPDALGPAATDRREQVRDRVVAYNSALAEVCGRDPLCRYDGGAVFDYRFTGAQLSPWDWFHPSRNGQQRLAEIAYARITAEHPAGSASANGAAGSAG